MTLDDWRRRYRLNRAQILGLTLFLIALFVVVSWSIISDGGWSLEAFLAIGLGLLVMLVATVIAIPIGLSIRSNLVGPDEPMKDDEDLEAIRKDAESSSERRP